MDSYDLNPRRPVVAVPPPPSMTLPPMSEKVEKAIDTVEHYFRDGVALSNSSSSSSKCPTSPRYLGTWGW